MRVAMLGGVAGRHMSTRRRGSTPAVSLLNRPNAGEEWRTASPALLGARGRRRSSILPPPVGSSLATTQGRRQTLETIPSASQAQSQSPRPRQQSLPKLSAPRSDATPSPQRSQQHQSQQSSPRITPTRPTPSPHHSQQQLHSEDQQQKESEHHQPEDDLSLRIPPPGQPPGGSPTVPPTTSTPSTPSASGQRHVRLSVPEVSVVATTSGGTKTTVSPARTVGGVKYRPRRRRAVTASDYKSCALVHTRLKLGDIM
ncbi:hypothetical protein J437_LFUL011484 [Ladona fulva]|uniref:Uncharacterized protein n=1 Tax=Ladona fulva TaxID=123851 RepID=A0A8K0KG12_LADFU|nr:hypothetical protein J437_LFUL011484 [Ladona fulva]